jgi:Na+/proline symporter
MITVYDYLNIFFYLAFIIGVGIYFIRRSKNTSDYFRAGGAMPWWISGAAVWMGSFSAWTFTGAAAKIYETGPYVLCLYYSSVLPLFAVLCYTCYRFRRMRTVTAYEAVRLRFGASSQQFYTWIRLPFLLFFGGVGLNAVGVFMSAVFNVDLAQVLVLLGVVVTVVSLLGGSFAVVASDFVQMFLVVTVAATTAVLVLARPEVGGVDGLLGRVPAVHFEWGQFARPEFITLWFLGLMLNNLMVHNSMENANKYLMAASDRQARLTLIIPILGTIFGPLIWIIPSMAASITHPDLASQFPQLRYPHEAAFLASAAAVLPQGMLGLLICGIFAATLTALDASLNQGAGIFVRNFYLPVINPRASEKRLLLVSKACTALFGAVIITVAILVSKYRNLGLFDLLNQLGISLLFPLAIPLFLGLFYKRTPSWSTWTTVLLGLGTAFVVKFHTGPGLIAWLPGFAAPFKPEEVTNYYIFATVASVAAVCVTWFFFTSLFYESSDEAYKASVEEFFRRLREPMHELSGEKAGEAYPIAAMIGKLSVLYGGVLMAMALIPNSPTGRFCYLACGGIMAGVGGGLWKKYRRDVPPPESAKEPPRLPSLDSLTLKKIHPKA